MNIYWLISLPGLNWSAVVITTDQMKVMVVTGEDLEAEASLNIRRQYTATHQFTTNKQGQGGVLHD